MVTDVRFDFEERKSAPQFRIACSMAMAIFFVEQLGALATKAKAQRDNVLIADCASAVKATLRAIDDGDRARPAAAVSPVLAPSMELRA
jgi:hypothetical protein